MKINKEFFDKHIQWENFRPYVFDRPSQPWIVFTITDKYGSSSKRLLTKKNKNKNRNKNSNNKKSRRNESEDE